MKRKKKKVKIELFSERGTQYSSLSEFLTKIENAIGDIPSKDVTLDIDTVYEPYEGDTMVVLTTLFYYGLETDDEYDRRITDERMKREDQDSRDMATYKKLKSRFEGD